MGEYCYQCERWFGDFNAYQQHVNTSAAHRQEEEWECQVCDRVFRSKQSLHQHCSSAFGHPYCVACERIFSNENNLRQHMHSKLHSSGVECPWCKNTYATASGLTVHLESGNCSSGLNRAKINKQVQQLDRNNIITRPMLTMGREDEQFETTATEVAWNGYAYECYFCDREFRSLNALNQHLNSPAHDQDLYRCPKIGCNRTYKILSGLIMHVESESCGLMRFSQVQRETRAGIQNMVGRMITG